MDRYTVYSTGLSATGVMPKNLHKSSKFLKLKGDISNSIKKVAVLQLYHIIRRLLLIKNDFYEVRYYFDKTCYLYIKTVILLVAFMVVELGRSASGKSALITFQYKVQRRMVITKGDN